MSVALRGARLGVPEQPADQQHAKATPGSHGSERVAQVIDANTAQPSVLADHGPACSQRGQRTVRSLARENIALIRTTTSSQLLDQLQRRSTQRQFMI